MIRQAPDPAALLSRTAVLMPCNLDDIFESALGPNSNVWCAAVRGRRQSQSGLHPRPECSTDHEHAL